jgi:hypothetical protein
MRGTEEAVLSAEIHEREIQIGLGTDVARPWPVHWSGVWVGALAALALGLVLGLAGIAVGAHQTGINARITKWSEVGLAALIFSVAGAFFSFVVGGWVAGKIAGVRRAETASLHGAIVWIVAAPLLLMLAALGAGSYFGGWYSGLAGTPHWAATPAAADPNAALIARNGALAALTVLLLGLMGSVVGGWLASGEPMTFTGHRKRARNS